MPHRFILAAKSSDYSVTSPLEDYFTTLRGTSKGGDFVYRSSCYPLTFERLRYEPRSAECAALISTLDQRFTPSDSNTPPPLPVLFGSKGIGKSTLLQRFPESAEYREHLALRYGGKQPIVAPISFTGEMGGGSTAALGLRTLFGAARAMGLLPEGMNAQWGSFLAQFYDLSSLSVSDAVQLLRRWIEKDRPVLFLVDDPFGGEDQFGAGTGRNLLTEVVAARDELVDTDAIVATSNIRPITQIISKITPLAYTVLPPLLHAPRIGAEVVDPWSLDVPPRMKDLAGKRYKNVEAAFVPVHMAQIRARLQAAPILTSGQPSVTAQLLQVIQEEPTCLDHDDSMLHPYHTTMHQILKKVKEVSPPSAPAQAVVDWTLYSEPVNMLTNMKAIKLVERGALFVSRGCDVPGHFYLSAPLHSVAGAMNFMEHREGQLRGGNKSDTRTLRTRTLDEMVGTFSMYRGTEEILPNIVCLTAASKSLLPNATVASIFGVESPRLARMRLSSPLTKQYSAVPQHKGVKRRHHGKGSIVADWTMYIAEGYTRFAHVTSTEGEAAWLYPTMQVDSPHKDPLSGAQRPNATHALHNLAACVVEAMDAHFCRFPNITLADPERVRRAMKDIYPVLYHWGDGGVINQETVTQAAFDHEQNLRHFLCHTRFHCSSAVKFKLPPEKLKELAALFLREYYDNIQIVNQAKMQEWLNPSFLPYTQYLSQIEDIHME